MKLVEIDCPIEFVVFGTPVSQRAKLPAAREAWKQRVKDSSREALPVSHFASEGRIAVTLYYFLSEPMQGDLDNILEPVLDALSRHVYVDDQQVEKLLVQRFDPEQQEPDFVRNPTEMLRQACRGERPALYVRITNDPREEFSS